MIRFFTKSDITHAATYITLCGDAYIIDSQKDGTNLRPFDKWQKEYNYDYIVLRSNNINVNDFIKRAFSLCGTTGYDFELFAIRYPFQIVKSWITGKDFHMPKKWGEDERMICSESVAWEHGIENSQDYTPKKLYDYCLKKNWQFIGNYKN